MASTGLDLTSLRNVIQRLAEGIARYQQDTSDTQIRDGLVQRFEFTYEISHKMLKRYLDMAAASPDEIENLAFPDLIRKGSEKGLLRSDWPLWRRYREMRGKTSHAYDEKIALEVVAAIPDFLLEAQFLQQQLEQRSGG